MDSQIGVLFWFTLHTITLAYPEKPSYEDQRHFHDFFLTLQYILPCKLCRQHYQQHLREYPVSSHLDSKESLVKWCFFLHNKVNYSLGNLILVMKNLEISICEFILLLLSKK